MEFEEIVSGQVWQYAEEGDNIEGEVVRKEAGAYGENLVLKVPSGEEFVIFTTTVLNNKFVKVSAGDYVKITYLGEKKSSKSGREYKDFKVEMGKK